jgi:hypothetical protein
MCSWWSWKVISMLSPSAFVEEAGESMVSL